MTDQELNEMISRKLSALLAISFLKDKETMTTAEGVKLLLRFHISNQEIADILGTTKRTVEVIKSRLAKQRQSWTKKL